MTQIMEQNAGVRTLAVLAFIALVAGGALYAAGRPTVARGDVLAADLVKSNPGVLRTLVCDPAVPIGLDGGTFWCDAVFRRGTTRRLHFQIARTGAIQQIGEAPGDAKSIHKSDPWD
jgi:hypothetical protein